MNKIAQLATLHRIEERNFNALTDGRARDDYVEQPEDRALYSEAFRRVCQAYDNLCDAIDAALDAPEPTLEEAKDYYRSGLLEDSCDPLLLQPQEPPSPLDTAGVRS